MFKKYQKEYDEYMLNFLKMGFDQIIHSETPCYEDFSKMMKGLEILNYEDFVKRRDN